MEDNLPKKMEDDLKKEEKNGRQPKKMGKNGRRPKKNKKWKTT